jgi:exosortase/archaeosortase family protein
LRRPDGGVLRFVAWLSLAVSVTFLVYPAQVYTFFLLLNGSLDDTFGTAFPAFPFAALLGVLFLLRWKDLHALLIRERGVTSRPWVRILGLALATLPLAFSQYSAGSLELSAASLIMVFYGTSLILNPSTDRILVPYASLYLAGVTVPGAIVYLFGEPLAGFSSWLSASMVDLAGIPVVWHGTEFELVSRAGDAITGVVTPGCSSVLSVTTFLGLLGLMYFDFRKSPVSTVKLAVVGTACLVLLNSARIGILIWAGYDAGAAALWGLHNWVGYAIFLGFYMVVLAVYSSIGRPKSPAAGLRSASNGPA